MPEGRQFVLPAKSTGLSMSMHHLNTVPPLSLQALSLSPLVYKVENFFSEEEARELIQQAHESFSRHPQYTQSDKMASHAQGNGSVLATTLRRRAFDLLGIFPFDETFSEGFDVSLSAF